MLELLRISRTNYGLLFAMRNHYSKPKGFVGRNICYMVTYLDNCFGFIVGGSATKHLPGRDEFFNNAHLDNIVNNIFFHIFPETGKYPIRNFASKVIKLFRQRIIQDWEEKYDGDKVLGFETLVELPRTGECYKRDGWQVVGQTKGFTCKRLAGQGSDDWSGKRVWNTKELKPKLVLVRGIN